MSSCCGCFPFPPTRNKHLTEKSGGKSQSKVSKSKVAIKCDNHGTEGVDTFPTQDSSSSSKSQSNAERTLLETESKVDMEIAIGTPSSMYDYSASVTKNENAPQLLTRPTIRLQECSGGFILTIASWNLLADGLTGIYGNDTKKKAFAHLPHRYLQMSYRVQFMILEVSRMNADVIVFEEFDLYKNEEFMAGMTRLGYVEGARKTKFWSPCLSIGGGLPADGISIFYKQKKFQENPIVSFTEQERHKRWLVDQIERDELKADENGLISVVTLLEGQSESDRPRLFKVIDNEVKDGNIDDAGFFDRDHETKPILFEKLWAWCNSDIPPPSAAIRLVPKSRPEVAICVIGTHLVSAKKESGERQRLFEMQSLLRHPNHEETKRDAHVFLCCDMNATCNDAMGYPPLTYDWIMQEYGGFKSATARAGQELDWTSWKKRIGKDETAQVLKYSVDFVFCPNNDLWRVIDVLGLPPDEECIESVRKMMEENPDLDGEPAPLPGKNYPSDHLSVCAMIEFVG